jgi:hypothetical protein
LQLHQPQALWVGYEFVHRIEAPVYVQTVQPLEPLFGMLLRAIALEPGGDAVAVGPLHRRLQVPAVIVQRVLVNMQEAGLLTRCEADAWQITDLGQHALRTNQVPLRLCERRVLPFVECLDAVGQRMAPPLFLPLADCVGVPWQVEPPHSFEASILRACIAQPSATKQARGFPGEIEALADDASNEVPPVLVDRPQRVLLVLILTPKEVLGFSVKVDGWTLNEREPVLRLPLAARALWADLREDVPLLTAWQDAWRSWCRQRQLPTNEVDACTLSYRAPRLEVQAPPRLVQRLQAAKSDLFKGEAWLLVGDGYVRPAALLAIK